MDNEIKEIDLLRLVAYIYHRKKVIIFSFILSICLGIIYINTLTKERVLYLNLDILKKTELYEYNLVNFIATKLNTLNKDDLIDDLIILDSETFGLFAKTIFDDRLIKNDIIKSNNFLNISLDDDIQLDNLVSNFELLEPILNKDAVNLFGRKLNPDYQLRLKTSLDLDKQNYKNLFVHVLNEIENRAKEKINEMYQTNIKIIAIKNGFELDNLKSLKQNLIDDYIINRKARLLYLEQNLSIAKAIEQNPQSFNQSSFIGDARITIYENEPLYENEPFPYYFFGSTAITQEILEVKKDMNVTDPSAAVDGILAIENEIREINQNRYSEEINIALDNSPLGENNTFKLFSYNVNDLKFKYEGSSNYLIIFLFGLIGIFSGLLLIFASTIRKKIINLS